MAQGRFRAKLAAGCLLAWCGAAAAQQPKNQPVTPAQILQFRPSQDAVVVTTPTGERTSVMVPATTHITRWVSLTASSLTAGTPVMVQAVSNGDGSLTASVVVVGKRGK